MRPEYDFRGGVRGKHVAADRQGHTTIVHQRDGSSRVTTVTRDDGTVMLEPDVREYFPDSASVNAALRALIAIRPRKSPARAKKTGT